MSVKIGTDGVDLVRSVGKTESFSVSPDDRQELVKLVDGALAVDGWGGPRGEVGDVVSLSATFYKDDAEDVIGWWNSRARKTVQLEDGSTIQNARIIVRRISYHDALPFRSLFTTLDLEFWRV